MEDREEYNANAEYLSDCFEIESCLSIKYAGKTIKTSFSIDVIKLFMLDNKEDEERIAGYFSGHLAEIIRRKVKVNLVEQIKAIRNEGIK